MSVRWLSLSARAASGARSAIALACVFVSAGCDKGSDPTGVSQSVDDGGLRAASALAIARAMGSALASTSASASASPAPGPVAGWVTSDSDFVETDDSRDPFRSFASALEDQTLPQARVQRQVMIDSYSLDELKLVGIVTGSTEARAMLVDPTGMGWIVKRGQYIGKPEIVGIAGSMAPSYEVNWRIDAIRPDDIVVVRQDPAQPGAPLATRIIALHPELGLAPVSVQ